MEVHSGGASTQRLPRQVGAARPRELVHTGRWLSADEARAMGLVARVAPAETFDAEVQSFAADLGCRSRDALARTKALVRHAPEVPLEAMERETVMWYYPQPEFAQGLEAFEARTAPKFS